MNNKLLSVKTFFNLQNRHTCWHWMVGQLSKKERVLCWAMVYARTANAHSVKSNQIKPNHSFHSTDSTTTEILFIFDIRQLIVMIWCWRIYKESCGVAVCLISWAERRIGIEINLCFHPVPETQFIRKMLTWVSRGITRGLV